MSITVYIGDDWQFPFQYLQSAGGSPVDMTNLTPAGELYTSLSGTPYDLTIGNGRVAVVSATNGQFTMKIERALTKTLPPYNPPSNKYPTRLQVVVTDGNGLKTTLGVLPLTLVMP